MREENVKINIHEHDNTTAGGRGIDSTDIAFVPGFSILESAPKNKPTLITDTAQFEKLFGKKARTLTYQDVQKYLDYGFKTGDLDRSYVYAKELLYQGLPILYANLVPDDLYAVSEDFTATCKETNEPTAVDGVITLTRMSDEEGEEDNPVQSDKNIVAKVVLTKSITMDPKTRKTLDFKVIKLDEEGNESSELSCAVSDIKEVKTSNVSDNVIELLNTKSKTTFTVEINFEITLPEDVDSVSFIVKERSKSLLDAFYGDESIFKSILSEKSETSIADKSVYSVKYITSGGYPSIVNDKTTKIELAKSKFAQEMILAAAHRGDAVALIDYQLNPSEKCYSTGSEESSFYSKMHLCCSAFSSGEFGAAMYPWSTYTCVSTDGIIEMPASFAYLMCLAKAIKTSPNWLAIAGVARGVVPGIIDLLTPNNVISNSIAENMQPKFGEEGNKISINCITNVRPYGLTLWGNRTLKPMGPDGAVALNFLNTRNMLSDIKKLLYTSAKSCMFEQNSEDLWLRFKDQIRPLLDRMKAGNGISDYKIVRGTTKYNGDPLQKGEIAAVIKIYPMYAVEYFELAVEINDQEVTVD